MMVTVVPKGGHCDMSDDDLRWLQWDGPADRPRPELAIILRGYGTGTEVQLYLRAVGLGFG